MASTLKVDTIEPQADTSITLTVMDTPSATITGGTITGITDLAVADGGTGASTAATARSNLGSTTVGDAVFIAASASAGRTALGLDTMSTQGASAVAITGGTITGITDITVADGGTGRSSTTEYAVICGGTTSTAAQQSIASVGTAGQILTSNGAGALPTFQSVLGGSRFTNSLSANVALNNTASFFTGPTVAQGTTGTWFASGTVTMIDSSSSANYTIKLWDGTTVIASARHQATIAGQPLAIAISGYISSPAGDIRISVKDESATSGNIMANTSGEAKDSTLSVFRIA